jgi:hypothetical protein
MVPGRRWLLTLHIPSEHVLFVIRRREFRMQRHPYEWPILAENHWPNHGRKLTLLLTLA